MRQIVFFGNIKRKEALENIVTTLKIGCSRGSSRPREMLLRGLSRWQEGISREVMPKKFNTMLERDFTHHLSTHLQIWAVLQKNQRRRRTQNMLTLITRVTRTGQGRRHVIGH